VKVKLPAAVGVPVIAPLDGLKFRPLGREPALISQLYGVVPPDAVRVCEHATPTESLGGVGARW
jgi:hypothetical protein